LAHLGDRARRAVPGADAAAVILLRHGDPILESSSGFARAVDRIQYRTGQGPCVDAAGQACIVVSGALGNGETRWPEFVMATRELEVASALSLPLMAENEVIGSVRTRYAHELTGPVRSHCQRRRGDLPTLAWVQGGQTGQAGLRSLAQVLAAACAHEARMAALDGEDEDR
jgi:hypothetical protein